MTGPPDRPKGVALRLVIILALAAVVLAAAASLGNPRLNFPVISQVVCSVRGDTWYGGGILGEPGCYAP